MMNKMTENNTALDLAERLLGNRPESPIWAFDDLMARPAQTELSLLEPYLPKVGLGVIAGAPDCGKSLFARQLALAVAAGLDEFCGLRLRPTHSAAIYVSTEDTIDDAQFVIEQQSVGLGVRHASPGFRYFDAAGAASETILRQLSESLSAQPADVIVIDGWGDVFGGKDGNSNMEVRRALGPFYALCSLHRCLIVFIHHVNKSAYDLPPKQGQLQGAGALAQKARVVLMLQREQDDARTLTATKGNRMSDEEKRRRLRLRLDPSTLLFSGHGFEPVREQNTTEYGAIDWDVIYGPHAKLRTAQLIDRLHEEYGMSKATAERRMKEELVTLERGVYGRRTEHEDYLDPYEPD